MFKSYNREFEWVNKVCDSKVSVVLVNVPITFELIPHYDSFVLLHLVHELLRQGVKANTIGVVILFTHHYNTIRTIFDSRGVEVVTVDKCDTLEKDCIIVHCMKGKNKSYTNKDFSKIHMAFTRTKCKLVIIGNEDIFKSVEGTEDYIKAIYAVGSIVNIRYMKNERDYCEKNYTSAELKLINDNPYTVL